MKIDNSLTSLTTIKDFTDNDYINILNILYGLDSINRITFKDNNKYNLSKENIIMNN